MRVVEFTDAEKPLLFQYVEGRFEFSEFNNPKMPERYIVLKCNSGIIYERSISFFGEATALDDSMRQILVHDYVMLSRQTAEAMERRSMEGGETRCLIRY